GRNHRAGRPPRPRGRSSARSRICPDQKGRQLRRLAHILAALVALCFAQRAAAQYYTWGSDAASLRWETVRTPDVRVIYPDTVRDAARRTLFYIEAVKPSIGYGFRHGPMPIPF